MTMSETTVEIKMGAAASNDWGNPAQLCQVLRVDLWQRWRREWIERQIMYNCRSRRGKKGESESVTQFMKLENETECGRQSTREVAL